MVCEMADRPDNWGTAEYWLKRAEEVQTMAEQCANPGVRANMTKIAEGYRRMAEHATAAQTANEP